MTRVTPCEPLHASQAKGCVLPRAPPAPGDNRLNKTRLERVVVLEEPDSVASYLFALRNKGDKDVLGQLGDPINMTHSLRVRGA
jgi:hypothetical protein